MSISDKLATHLYLANLSSQLIKRSMAVNLVGNVIIKTVTQHALPIILVYAVSFAQPREGVAAVMGGVFGDAQLP